MIVLRTSFYLLLFSVLFASCKLQKKQETTVKPTDKSVKQVDSAIAAQLARKPEYRASATRTNDIINTKLDVRFDWQKQYLYGKAIIKVKPYFYPTSTLVLNAREMEIKEIALVDTSTLKIPLSYTYKNDSIVIKLNKEYKNNEEYSILINYISKPNELKKNGGSSAITDDKGLYFINPDDKDMYKPKQIWTQGETQANSVWFPTIDQPNERMTEEICITTEKKNTTLSNGELEYSIDNGDSTRTDCWKMSMPHAPYLVMMAVGEFAIVKDKWRDKEVNYYVEKEYEPYAKAIFGNTPEMMELYSKLLGVEFPWNKYSQIVVRDYVSGAMENTTAALFGEFVQRNDRELLDKNYEFVVAHELFHEWFGDYVTCESWSNIPLNESFATYGEYLWQEHKYGREAADYHSEKSRDGYLNESAGKQVPLIRYYYNDKEDVFDAHSYNKGGQILHMLRKYVGDDAFFASLKLYLETNKLFSVESANLRLAFEKVTGEDLNWFFNQWFLSPGHPNLEITSTYDATSKKEKVRIKQTQDVGKTPIYKLPLAIDVYANGKKERHNITVTNQDETFEFNVASAPDLVNVDAEKMLLCAKSEQKSVKELTFQYNHAPLYLDRKEALKGLLKSSADSSALAVILSALHDKMWSLRTYVLGGLTTLPKGHEPEIKMLVCDLALKDSVANVRAAAINYLAANYKDKDLQTIYKKALNDRSYAVLGSALAAITRSDSAQGLALAKQYENEKNKDILIIIAEIYSKYGDAQNNEFYLNSLNKIVSYPKATFISYYGTYLNKIKDETAVNAGIEALKKVIEKDAANKWAVNSAKKVVLELEAKTPKKEEQK
jgi:aminopeptidase N